AIRDLTLGRSHIPVLSAGNVFQGNPAFTGIRDLTGGRNHIHVLSVGNVFQTSPDSVHTSRSHLGESRIPVLSVGNVFRESPILTHIRDLTQGRSRYSSGPECGKCFSVLSLLTQIQRSHTGAKPYSCPKYRKCFSQTSHVDTTSEISHTGGGKTLSCPE
ncbi:unnamed protein product, partial [Staurois parvus]